MQFKEINPENFRAVAKKVKEHVRILAIRHDVVLYYAKTEADSRKAREMEKRSRSRIILSCIKPDAFSPIYIVAA